VTEPKITRRKITDYRPALVNPNAGTERGVAVIEDSLANNGAGRSLLADKDGEMIAGSHTLEAMVNAGFTEVIEIETDGKTPVVVKRTDLSIEDPRGRALQIVDNRANEVGYNADEGVISSILADIQERDKKALRGTGYNSKEIDALLEGVEADTAELMDSVLEDNELDSDGVPDALWPTDNDWGVPVLDLAFQADAVDLPVNAYGAEGRKSKMNGTYHMYTDDYRFEGLWRDPTPILNSGCVNVVEPNFSTNVQMPPALVLFHTYRKRWLARYWQSFGVRIFVDLDVNPAFDHINMLGVPKGWKSYACYMRKSDHKPEELLHFLEVAKTHAESDSVLLLVVGGEKPVQELCKQNPQCVWAASFEQKFYRNYRQKSVSE